MKEIKISQEVYSRSEIAIVAELDRLTKIRGFANIETTFCEAYRLTHGCRISFPPPIRGTENMVPLPVWTLYFDNEEEATLFLLKWS